MSNIALIGQMGAGKTLWCTIKAIQSTRLTLTTYKINAPNCRLLTKSDLIHVPDNCNIILDEGYTLLESRTSSSKMNRHLSHLLFQGRKRNIDFCTTLQLSHTIDIRFRDLLDVIIQCEFNVKHQAFIYTYTIPNTNRKKRELLPYSRALKYFDLYDTYETVDSHDLDELEAYITMKSPILLKDKMKELANQINVDGKLTHDSLKYQMLLNDIPLSYEKFLYVYLKGA